MHDLIPVVMYIYIYMHDLISVVMYIYIYIYIPFSTFILLNALTTDGLYMAYHFPSQQYIGLQECKHCFAIILRGGCSRNCPDSDSVNEDVSFLQYILSTNGEIIIDQESSSPVLRGG